MASETQIPTPLTATDVLVVGGGFAGVAAALAAASAGRRTCLIERRTYLGAELTATLRPWLTAGQLDGLKELLGLPGEVVAPASGGTELAVIPDLLKSALEDLLLAAGVQLLYGLRPVGLRRDQFFRVEVAGKFGTGLITAAVLVDATEQAHLARRFGRALPRYEGGLLEARRTLELTGVAAELLEQAALPDGCRVHLGHAADHGHLLVEHALELQPGQGVSWMRQAEAGARFATMALARRLMEGHPAFSGARVTETAHDLTLPPLWRVSPHLQGLWVAGGCSDQLDDRAAGEAAHDPLALARLGQAVGEAAAAAVEGTPPEGGPEAGVWPAERRQVDLLVIGGGTSGASCAIGAARQGSRTLLVEMNPGLGGTGTIGGVDSYWFGRKGGFNREVSRWVEQEHAWMNWKSGKWNVEGKMIALLGAVREAGVELLLNSILVAVRTSPEGRVTGALVATEDGLVEVEAKVTVDCTGDGDAAVQAGAGYVYGSDREGATMWYSMAPHLWPGMTKNNFTSPVDVGDPFDCTRAVLSARRRLPGHDHGPYIAPRESRHITGGVRITLTDILTMRRWPDVVNIHFSNHDVKGHNTSDWIRMGLIPPNLEMELPYRALLPEGVDGLLVVGKAFSATHDALPPLRMQADLENLGFVAGTAAALAAARGITPRELPVQELQAVLVEAEILPPSILTRAVPEAAQPVSEGEMRRWIAALDDAEKLFFYGEMEMDEVRREPIPMVMVCTAGPGIIPLLKEELAREGSPRRLHVARALAWYGDRAATPVLLAEIERRLTEAGETVPARTDHIRYCQASPDHGAMPELCYLLHSLAMARDERAIEVLMPVAERLHPTYERFLIHQSGLFHYVDAVCDIAEGLGRRESVPALKRIHGCELFRNRQSTALVEPDFYLERLAFLEVVLGRAMARCGEREGLRILISYLTDSRRALLRHAHQELKAISGLDMPPDPAVWSAWAEGMELLEPRPWMRLP